MSKDSKNGGGGLAHDSTPTAGNNQVDALSETLFIPENIANMIVGEYRAKVIDYLKDEIRKLDTDLGDMMLKDGIWYARTAYLNAINILEERNHYRAYKIAGVPKVKHETLR